MLIGFDVSEQRNESFIFNNFMGGLTDRAELGEPKDILLDITPSDGKINHQAQVAQITVVTNDFCYLKSRVFEIAYRANR